MIGFYNYTVILTYVSLAISAFGITQAMCGRPRVAIVCLALSGLCDMFDGKIARRKKDRTEEEKSFGIQIDSLCDVVCFGIFPTIICYQLGVKDFLGILLIVLYSLNSVIRLAFYNVMEENNALVSPEGEKYYRGLPITTMSIVLPLVFLLKYVIPQPMFQLFLRLALLIVGALFVVDFKLRKPKNSTLAFLVLLVACALLIMIYFSCHPIRFFPRNLSWL